MPIMNGGELAEALQRIRPGIPVLYMSGYVALIMTELGMLDPGVTVLRKPFLRDELLAAMNATLGAGKQVTAS
jgi:CheY-like chemotaxis protein